jgi:outer membrane protein TolC
MEMHVTTRKTLVVLACTAVLACVAQPATAQQPPASTETRANELVKEALARYAEGLRAQTPSTAVEGASYALTLDDAVKRALDNNLDIAVERLNPQTFDLTIAGLLSSYHPTATSRIGQQNMVRLPNSLLNGGTRVNNDTVTYNAGMTQNLRWGGGNIALGFNNQRVESSDAFATFNPQYQNSFNLTYVQPLLRNFRIDGTRQQLATARINREVSEVQLRGRITNTLASVRNAYWDYVYAVQAVDVARQSLALAQKLLEDNRVRVEVGTMAPLDIVQAEAEAATRRQNLTQAEATLRTSELALKRLIVSGTNDPLWASALNPVDRPAFEPEDVDLEAAVRTALQERTDLEQSRRNLESNDINLRALRDQTLPSVDLVTGLGMQGLGGTQYIRQGQGLNSVITGTIAGGYQDAWRSLWGRDYPNWNFQVNVSYPIGGSNAEANLARARLQRTQQQAQLRALELQVATEVTNAALQVQNNIRSVEASSAARELSQKRLDAEQSRFEVGMSTNYQVVQAQRDLRDAQNAELRAQLNYRKSLVEFERVQQSGQGGGGGAGAAGGGGGGGSAAPSAATQQGGGGQGGGGR